MQRCSVSKWKGSGSEDAAGGYLVDAGTGTEDIIRMCDDVVLL